MYCIAEDYELHEYVIPWDRRFEWWQFLDEDESSDVPSWAMRIDGGTVVFPEFQIRHGEDQE